MSDENKFILFLCRCEHLTIILRSSLHPVLEAVTIRGVPYTSSFSLSFLPLYFFFIMGDASTFIFKDGGPGRCVIPV